MAKQKSKALVPTKVSDMTATQAVQTFTDHEHKVFEDLQKYIKAHNRETLEWYWQLGQRLTLIRVEAKKDKEHYGSKLLERIGVALGYKSANPLYQAISVVEAFGTKKALSEYTKLAGEAGNVLTWGHIVMLSGISDVSVRLDLAATALEQCWSVETLGNQVRSMVDRKSRGVRTGKKKVKIPTSVKKCLHDVTAKADQFREWVESSWTGDAFDIKAQIEDTPASNLNDKLLEDFIAAQKQLADMIESAETMADELSGAEAAIRRKMAAQEAADLQAAAEAAADAEDDTPLIIEEDPDEEADQVDDDASLADLAIEEAAAEVEAAEPDDDEEEFISIGAERNAKLREARALARAKERKRAARK